MTKNTENVTYFVPFLVDLSKYETTFSMEAQHRLEMARDGESFLIMFRSTAVRKGEENVLGLNFLDESLMAFDFYFREVGLYFGSSSGDDYELNWPLNTFKDIDTAEKVNKTTERYHKLKQYYDKLIAAQQKEIENFETIVKERDEIIKKLNDKKTELTEKIKNKQKRRKREDL